MRNPIVAGMLAVGVAFVIGLWAAFQIRARLPELTDDAFGAGVAFGIVAISVAVMALIYRGPWFSLPAARRGEHRAVDSRPYALPWSVAEAAYSSDLNATATCSHLAPIERAMRQAHIETRLVTEPWHEYGPLFRVKAKCTVNVAKLALPAGVEYKGGYQPDRYEFDNPWASLACGECASHIEMAHSEWGRGTLPVFP